MQSAVILYLTVVDCNALVIKTKLNSTSASENARQRLCSDEHKYCTMQSFDIALLGTNGARLKCGTVAHCPLEPTLPVLRTMS